MTAFILWVTHIREELIFSGDSLGGTQGGGGQRGDYK